MSSEAENTPSSSGAAMLNQPIVMDCGTATIKAGFAGGTKPKVRYTLLHVNNSNYIVFGLYLYSLNASF